MNDAVYRPFDQHVWLGDPPWSGPALARWEVEHGHDVRLGCFSEYGCLVAIRALDRIVAAARSVIAERDDSQLTACEQRLRDALRNFGDE